MENLILFKVPEYFSQVSQIVLRSSIDQLFYKMEYDDTIFNIVWDVVEYSHIK